MAASRHRIRWRAKIWWRKAHVTVYRPVRKLITVGTIFFGESLTFNIIAGLIITLIVVTFMVVTGKK